MKRCSGDGYIYPNSIPDITDQLRNNDKTFRSWRINSGNDDWIFLKWRIILFEFPAPGMIHIPQYYIISINKRLIDLTLALTEKKLSYQNRYVHFY